MFSYYNQFSNSYTANVFNNNFGILAWDEPNEKKILDLVAYEIRTQQDYGAFIDSIDLILPHIDVYYYSQFKNNSKVFCNMEKYYYNKHLIEYLAMITNDNYSIKSSNVSLLGINPFKSRSFSKSLAQSYIININNDEHTISKTYLEKIFVK